MFQILEARPLAPDVKLFRIQAPRVARKRQAGQFVILRVHEHGERIPITIADSSAERGDITIVVQGIGKTTKLLNCLEAGDSILDVVGPLGKPSEVENFGTACVIGGGVGAAIAYPTAVALKQAGNRVISILGRPQPRAGGPRGRDPRRERRAPRHHRRRQLRREGPRHRQARRR